MISIKKEENDMKRFLPITWRTRKTFLITMAYTLGTLFAAWTAFMLTCFLLLRYTHLGTTNSFFIGLMLGLVVMVAGQIKRIYPFTYMIARFNTLNGFIKKRQHKLEVTAERVNKLYDSIAATEQTVLNGLAKVKKLIQQPSQEFDRKELLILKDDLARQLAETRKDRSDLDQIMKKIVIVREELAKNRALTEKHQTDTPLMASIGLEVSIIVTKSVPEIFITSMRTQKQVRTIQQRLDHYPMTA